MHAAQAHLGQRLIGLIGLLACLAASGITGCAGTTVARISDKQFETGGKYSDDDAKGIRYYESAPFLLVYSDGKGGLTSQLLFLPDQTQKRTIDPYAVLASNNSTLTFTNGVLTQGKTVADATVVPKAIIGSLEKIASAAIASALSDGDEGDHGTQLPPPQLYRIVLSGNSAKLVGGPGVDADGKVRMIDVTLSKSADDQKPAAAGAGGTP
jgi:hypothetical protein